MFNSSLLKSLKLFILHLLRINLTIAASIVFTRFAATTLMLIRMLPVKSSSKNSNFNKAFKFYIAISSFIKSIIYSDVLKRRLLQIFTLFFLGFGHAFAYGTTSASQGAYIGKVTISTDISDLAIWNWDNGCTVTLVRNGIDIQSYACLAFSNSVGYFTDNTVSGTTQYTYAIKRHVQYDSCYYDYNIDAFTCDTYMMLDTTNPAIGWAAPPIPSQVTGLSASQALYYGTVALSWTASANATQYDVYRSGILIASNITGTSYNNTGLLDATQYYYQVVAKNTSGSAPASAAAWGWSKVPSILNTLTASQGTVVNAVQLSWTAVTDATIYNVYRSSSSGGALTLLTTTATTSYTDSTTGNNISYYYKVIPLVGTFVGSLSNEAVGWGKNPIPSKVNNVIATQGTLYGKSNVSWTADPLATSYDVYRSTAAGTRGALVGASIASISFDDITVSGSTHYFYTVVAKNASGSAPDSNQAQGWGKVPTNIIDLTATDGLLQNKVALSWSKDINATGYQVWRSASAGGAAIQIASLGVLATGYYEDTIVSGMTHYYYTVKTVANASVSPSSNEDMGYVLIPTVKVTGVTATQGTLYGKSLVSWTSDPAAANYDVYRSTAAGTKGSLVGTAVLGASFNDNTVSGTTHYFYTIVAKNLLGISPDSNQAEGWGKIPGTLTDLTATQGTLANKVGLSWSKDSDATGYQVWRSSTSGGVATQIATLGVLATGYYEDSAVSGTTHYFYTVKTVAGTTVSQPSNEAMGYAMTLPIKVTGVTATQGTLYAKSRVSWSADPAAASYDVYRSTAAGTKGSLAGVDVVGTSFDDSTVSGATHYFYTLVSKNAMGLSPDSDQAEGWGKVPAVVTDLTASKGQLNGSVSLNWSNNPDAESYDVWRSISASGPFSKIAGNVVSNTYTDNTVSGVTSYFYTVNTNIGAQTSAQGNIDEGWANAAPTAASAAITTSSTEASAATAPLIIDPNETAGKTEQFTLAITTPPSTGTLTLVNNKFIFTPPADGLFSGNLTFVFQVTDQGGQSLTGSGTIQVSCPAPALNLLSVPDAMPYDDLTATINYQAEACNGPMSGILTVKQGSTVIETQNLSSLIDGADVNVTRNMTGLASGDYIADLSLIGIGGIDIRSAAFTVKTVPQPTIKIIPATGLITQSETLVTASLEPSLDTACLLTMVQSVAEADSNRCFVALTTTLSGMTAGTDAQALPTYSGRPSLSGNFSVQAVLSRWVKGIRHDSEPVLKPVNVIELIPPTFVMSGDTDVYMGIEKVSLTLIQESGAPYSFYADQATAQIEAGKGNRAALISFTGQDGLTTSTALKQIKLEGTLATVGVQKIQYAATRVFADGMTAPLQTGELSVTVNPLVPPTVTLKGGNKISEGKYYVQMGQAITNAVVTAGVPTTAKMKITVTDSQQSTQRANVMSGGSFWISTPSLTLLEERPVTLRVAWQDYPSIYNEQVITAVGGTDSNMKLVLDSAQKVADTTPITVKVNVGKYTTNGLTYTPETMGQWRTQILMQSNTQEAKVPVTGLVDTVNGEATFQINPAGKLWMKLTAVSELVSNVDGLSSTLESSTRYIEVVKGSVIEGAISSKVFDAPAPKTFTLNLDMTADNRVALKEVAWEESTDDGVSYTAIAKSNTLRHNVGLPAPAKRQVRAKMVNKNTLVESYTSPVEVWAYSTLEAAIIGPRHVAPGYTATLAAELYRQGVLTTNTVNEWTVVAPGGTTTSTGDTVTISSEQEGKVYVTLKSRPADTRADDLNAWTIARNFLAVKIPTKPSVSAKGPRDVEIGKSYHYEGAVRPSWGAMTSVHNVNSEWQKPDGSIVAGSTLDWTPTVQDMSDTKPLLFRAWVEGFKDSTTSETTLSYVPWEYVWPNFIVSMKQLTVQAPSDVLLSVDHDLPAMNRRFEGLTYDWSFPVNVEGRQNAAFPNRAAGHVIYAGEYDINVTVRDSRGHETVLTQHVVTEQAVPYSVTLKVGKSNAYERAPMTVTVRPTIYGGHPLDAVIGQLWKVDGVPVDEFTNRSYLVSSIADAGNHVLSYTLNSRMGETTTVEAPLTLAQNQIPVCQLTAVPNVYVVYAEAKCTDPDGKVIGYSWLVNGQPISSTSYRISFGKTDTPQSASVSITSMDDAKELSVPVSINVNY